MDQSSEGVDRTSKMLDETVRRVVMSMPGNTIDIIELRSELAKALHDGPTTLFHLFKVGRDLATRGGARRSETGVVAERMRSA